MWVLLPLVILTVLPWFVDLRPNEIDLMKVLQPPSRSHPLGTDENGRDVLRRLLAGAQFTIGIGVASAALSLAIGTIFGAVSGSVGGMVDDVIMRFTDLVLALPTLFVILVFSTLVRPGVLQLVLLIGLTGWMPVARVVRGAARDVRARQFVVAAQSYGAGGWWIVRHHIIPNLQSVIAITGVMQLSRAILTEATISFLGMGIQPPDATWGSMLSSAQGYLLLSPHLAFAPGVALAVTLLSVATLSFHDQKRL